MLKSPQFFNINKRAEPAISGLVFMKWEIFAFGGKPELNGEMTGTN